LRSKVIHQRLELFYIGGCEKIPFESTSEEMLGFVQRTSRNLHKTLIVLEIMAARPFGNVRTYAVGTAHDLFADRILGKRVPSEHDSPNFIS